MLRSQMATSYITENFAEQDRLALVLIDRSTGFVQQKLMLAAEIVAERFQAYLRPRTPKAGMSIFR